MSPEHKAKISASLKGKKRSKEYLAKISILRKKIFSTPEHREKLRQAHLKGKPAKTPQMLLIRNSFEYKLWRTAVYERDNYTCVFCGQRGYRLNADHIKPFSLFPELRFAIDNGRTLCIDCHKKTPTYGINARYLKNIDYN